jgi:hypothetical protein
VSSHEKNPLSQGALPRNRSLHDGTWMLSRLAPEKRIDWDNSHRAKTVALFGEAFYRECLMERIRRVCSKNHPTG